MTNKEKIEKIKKIVWEGLMEYPKDKKIFLKDIWNIINEPEQPQFRKGQIVEFSDDGIRWHLGIFSDYSNKKYKMMYEDRVGPWDYCRYPSWEIIALTLVPREANYITCGEDFEVFWFLKKPSPNLFFPDCGFWNGEGGKSGYIFNIPEHLRPKNFDWKKSLIEL